MWTHGTGRTGAPTFPTSAPTPLFWEEIHLIKGFNHSPEFLEGLSSSHKSLYNALSQVISPVLCHFSMQCFRMLREPESRCRSRSSASTTPAEVCSGALTINTSCPGAVQMKQKEKPASKCNCFSEDNTEIPQTGWKVAASQPLVVFSVTDTQGKWVLQSVFQVYTGEKSRNNN